LANGGTHAVAFSPNGKLAAIGSVRFDKDTDTSTGAVSVVRAGSGISEWQQTVAGWAGPVAFSPDGKSVVVLCGRRLIQFLDTETGSVKDEIRPADSLPEGGRRSDFAAPHPYLLTWNSLDGGRWNDFAVAPQRHMLVIGGVDKYKQGCVEVWDFNAAEKAASQSGANAGESIAEPVFPQREPGRTRVRVTQFSAMPVSVTHPDKIVSGGNTPKNKEATQP
jgi:WD40 repeat protein